MKILYRIYHVVCKRVFVLLLYAIFIVLVFPLQAQNEIMFVLPKRSLTANTVSSVFEKTIVDKVTHVKTKVGYATYTDKEEGRQICYSKIRGASIKYLLKLDEISDVNSSFKLKFSLSKVNVDNSRGNLFEEDVITWPNSTFLIKKNAKISKEINDILLDLNDEIVYYFENEKFRSRIFINPDDFLPGNAEFYTDFIDWLQIEMNTAEHEKRDAYIVYYDNKPYPKNADYVLYGKFSAEDQAWSDVQFYILYNSKTLKSRAVRINVEDFEYGGHENSSQYKKEVVNKIYSLLSRYD